MSDPADFAFAPASVEPADPPPETAEDLERQLSRTMLRTAGDWQLLEEGDRIMVAVSGGKDSYTMLELLERARRRAPVRFEILAFHLDQAQPGYDGEGLRAWLESSGVPWRIHREDTYSVVLEKVEGTGKSYCGPCSRFRRGILYTWAEKLGCNKIALGHHRDDALETLLLNLFWGGKLQAMPARFTTQDGRFDVIRPLIECDQTHIAAYARWRAYPIIPCNLCGSQDGLKRAETRRLLADLESRIPNVRAVMLAALKNVRPSHLLDREVAEAWDEKSSHFGVRR
jgi:tRNA 2-thiocytidine biosynthesis protein TtcA